MVPGLCESVYCTSQGLPSNKAASIPMKIPVLQKPFAMFCQAVPSERLEQLQRCARWQVDPWAFPGLWGAMGKNGKSKISERVGVFFRFDRV